MSLLTDFYMQSVMALYANRVNKVIDIYIEYPYLHHKNEKIIYINTIIGYPYILHQDGFKLIYTIMVYTLLILINCWDPEISTINH